MTMDSLAAPQDTCGATARSVIVGSLAAPQDTCGATARSVCSLDSAPLRSLAAAHWVST